MKIRIFLAILLFGLNAQSQHSAATHVYPATYLADLKAELQTKWPENRTVNIVFHGHSVPAGYFKTPQVNHPNELGHELIANEIIKWFQ